MGKAFQRQVGGAKSEWFTAAAGGGGVQLWKQCWRGQHLHCTAAEGSGGSGKKRMGIVGDRREWWQTLHPVYILQSKKGVLQVEESLSKEGVLQQKAYAAER